MYEQTTANFNSCESDMVSGASQANPGYYHPHQSWLLQSLRMGCPACDRRRSRVCNHQTADRSNTATPPNIYQPQAPYGYRYENILDANCNCYRLVLVQNQP
jgi:hypothetical protein